MPTSKQRTKKQFVIGNDECDNGPMPSQTFSCYTQVNGRTRSSYVGHVDYIRGRRSDNKARHNAISQNVAMLYHPHLANVYKARRLGKHKLMVYQYGSENNLLNYVHKRGKLSEAYACLFFRQMVSAIDYLHQQRLVHRYLKPAHICFAAKKQIKVTGYNLMLPFDDGQKFEDYWTSLYTQAPEMVNRVPYAGPPVDIWALGVLLFFMLTGEGPFDGMASNEVRGYIKRAEYHVTEYMSDTAQDLISKIFVVDPKERITMEGIKEHPWVRSHYISPVDNHVPARPETVPEPHRRIVKKMKKLGYNDVQAVLELSQEHAAPTRAVCVYHLLQEQYMHSKIGSTAAVFNSLGTKLKAMFSRNKN